MKQDTTVSETNKEISFLREPLEKTPFDIITEDGKHFAVIGMEIVTEKYEDKEELLKTLETPTWELLTAVVGVIVKKTIEFNKSLQTTINK